MGQSSEERTISMESYLATVNGWVGVVGKYMDETRGLQYEIARLTRELAWARECCNAAISSLHEEGVPNTAAFMRAELEAGPPEGWEPEVKEGGT
jgi:hypothetical protein